MLKSVKRSLVEMLGDEYIDKVCCASAALGLGEYETLYKIAAEPVDFYPESFAERVDSLLEMSGKPLSPPLERSANGAGTKAFDEALHRHSAPLSGMGPFRVGEDGKLAIIGKSEHYQASLGHNFPGAELLHRAVQIGITNITHNNTRGHITRLLEEELIRIANGLEKGDTAGLQAVLESTDPHALNRVINLETGSLACEAAFKMMLARFYKLQSHFDAPLYHGKTPVFVVMADRNGGKEANYHGTTILTQMLRGMWHELYEGMEKAGLLRVAQCAINDIADFKRIVAEYDSGAYKIAGFVHELVLMNYGGIRLTEEFVQTTHQICRDRDIPVFVDEIQSCMWSPELFLFKEYQCHPDFVSVGKGFPAGHYPASRILLSRGMDNLNQFGALVTNGQEELASLANLITIEFAEANKEHTAEIGALWQKGLQQLAAAHPAMIRRIEGDGMLGTIFFDTPEITVDFCKAMSGTYGMDISAQTYKANCPPAALTKIPLVSSGKLVEFLLNAMDQTLIRLEK